MILLISTLKVVLFSRKLSNFHWLFSFPVTNLLYRNEYSIVPLLFVILISLPLQYFYKYDCDYPSDDKTGQTLPKLFARIHFFLIVSRDDAQEFRQEKRTKITNRQCRCPKIWLFGSITLPIWKVVIGKTVGIVTFSNAPIPENNGSGRSDLKGTWWNEKFWTVQVYCFFLPSCQSYHCLTRAFVRKDVVIIEY